VSNPTRQVADKKGNNAKTYHKDLKELIIASGSTEDIDSYLQK